MKTSFFVLLGIFLCFGLASSTWAAQAKPQKSCLYSDPAQTKILSQFKWATNDPQLKEDLCDPDNLVYRVAKALLFVKSLEGLHLSATDKFDRGVISPNPFQFFSSRIKTLVFEPETSCRNLWVAYVIGPHDGIMHICPHLADIDNLSISSTLIHEARHQDGYDHATCDHGYFQGSEAACDQSFVSGGSYAVQAEYEVKISRSEKVKPDVRQNARSQAIGLFMERFNSLPLGIQKGAILVPDNLEVQFYDGNTTTPLHRLAHPKMHLMLSQGLLVEYDPTNNVLAPLSDGISTGPIVKDFLPNKEADKFVDYIASPSYQCFLYTDLVKCTFAKSPQAELVLPIEGIIPRGFLRSTSFDPSYDANLILSKDYKTYSISKYTTTISNQKPGSSNSVYVSDWDNTYQIELHSDGKVMLVDKTYLTDSIPAPGLSSEATFTKMIAPYYWSKELQEL